MKKCSFLITFAIAASTFTGTSHLAYADGSSDDEVLPPIVFLLLDTSGSMNEIFDPTTNNTRLTNALAEIIGGATNKDSSHKLIRAECGKEYKKEGDECLDNGKKFTMPFPELNLSTGGYEQKNKLIRENAQIARPANTSNYTTVDASYDQNGVIQDYLSMVKFGFAGFAVGSGGSVGKDSIIQQAAALAGGRTADTKLRFTMIWGHKTGDSESDSDLDSHLFITSKGGTFGNKGHISYMNYTEKGGRLDVDNTNPKGRHDQFAVCYDKVNNIMDKCSSLDPTHTYDYNGCNHKYPHIGVENIYWSSLTTSSGTPYFNEGDTLTFVAQPYRMSNSITKGYDLEIAFDDENGCQVVYTYTFNKDIPSQTERNNYENGYPAVVLTYNAKGSFDIYPTPSSATFKPPASCGNIGQNKYGKDGFRSPSDFTIERSSSAGEPLYIYGKSLITATSDRTQTSISYGKLISDDYKTKPRDCTYDIGIWDLSSKADAPLIYPTASDDVPDIENNNRRLINAVRTYTATAATPIGEALADIYYMFGGANTTDITQVDQGLTKYFDDNGFAQDDKKFNCESRKKSVILISDGIPNGSGLLGDTIGTSEKAQHGYSVAIWNDTNALAKRKINVFVIGYSELFKNVSFPNVKKNSDGSYYADESKLLDSKTEEADMNKYGAYILSKAAWKGGTCLDENNNILPYSDSKDDEQRFLDFLYRYNNDSDPLIKKHNRLCFYNALDKNSLRVAIVSALSQSTSSTFSKTPVVTTTAVGYNTSLTDVKQPDGSTKKSYTNGFYNIFSGYKSYLGNKRDSFLERSVFICQKDGDGKYGFQIDSNNETTNIARRHDCQILSCELELDEARYEQLRQDNEKKGLPAPDKVDKTTGLTETQFKSPCTSRKDGTNTCLNSRIIFAGDYSEARNKIYPNIAKLHDGKIDDLSGTTPKYEVKIGHIKDGKGPGVDEHFMTQSNSASCHDALHSELSNTSEANKNSMYMVSPYECYSELDCNYGSTTSSTKYLCKRGRCVVKDSDYSLPSSLKACKKQSDCGLGQVCHADCDDDGNNCTTPVCTAGILKSCDIRSFIASQRLGTIKYATPTVVEPPNRSYKNADYNIFQQKYWRRDTTLLVGANDGMLHNFILGDNVAGSAYTDSSSTFGIDKDLIPSGGIRAMKTFSEGDEIWGFIPKAIMPKVRHLINSGDQTNVNAAPTVADVQSPKSYYEDPSFDDTFTVKTTTGETQVPVKWRTVAVGGFRDGARGYYALDITNPGKPRVLWEIDPTWKATSNSENMDKSLTIGDEDTVPLATFNANLSKQSSTTDYYPFLQLGKTYAQPLVTTLIINNKDGVPESVPIAILSGGLSSNQSKVSDHSTIDNYIGRVMYIVRLFPKTPEELLVKTFYFQNEITGAPSIYPNNFGLPAQLVYFGDNTGAIFRLDVKSHNPSDWGSYEKLNISEVSAVKFEKPVFNPQDFESNTKTKFFEKITHKPAVALYKMAGNRPIIQIAIGTGSNDNLNVNTGSHNYVAVFYDFPNSDGSYTLNSSSQPGKLLAFNAPRNGDDLLPDADVTFGSEKNPQKFRLYFRDPADKKIELKTHQKMTGAPLIYNYDVYFPTYIGTKVTDGTDDICAVGHAAIYAIRDKDTKHGTLDSTKIQNKNAPKSGTLSPEVQKFIDGGTSILELAKGTKVYGLQITNQLYCGDKDGGSFAVPQLIAQTGSDPGMSAFDKDSQNNLVGQTSLSTFSLNLEGIQSKPNKVKWATVYE